MSGTGFVPTCEAHRAMFTVFAKATAGIRAKYTRMAVQAVGTSTNAPTASQALSDTLRCAQAKKDLG